MPTLRTTLTTAAAVVAAAAGGGAIANAADSGTAAGGSGSGHERHTVGGKSEQALTGTTATKVRAAALAKVPGGTIDRLETNVDGDAPYEAHVTKADGSEVEVQVSKDFTVAAVNAVGDHDGDGPGHP